MNEQIHSELIISYMVGLVKCSCFAQFIKDHVLFQAISFSWPHCSYVALEVDCRKRRNQNSQENETTIPQIIACKVLTSCVSKTIKINKKGYWVWNHNPDKSQKLLKNVLILTIQKKLVVFCLKILFLVSLKLTNCWNLLGILTK